jgi:DNA-binding winged helix-turn-helix (wHTH) protein/TolB-like protein
VSLRQIVRFGVFEFDAAAGELRSGDARIRLEPQPARVLALLVARAGDVVTRNELRDHVWQADTFVDFERGLNYCVAQIRAALGDSATAPRFIETLPRRGYRFLAAVAPADHPATPLAAPPDTRAGEAGDAALFGPPSSAPARDDAERETMTDGRSSAAQGRPALFGPGRRTWVPVAGLALCLLAGWTVLAMYRGASAARSADGADGRVRLAVALFDNETGDPAYDAIAQQLTDLTVSRLAANPDRLGVIGNAAMLRQRRTFRDIDAIRSALGVRFVILGQIQRQPVPPPPSDSSSPASAPPTSAPATFAAPMSASMPLRVIVHLIRTDDQTHLWANRFVFDAATPGSVEAAVPPAVERAVTDRILRR